MAVRKVGYQEGLYQAQIGAWRSLGRKHPVFFMLYPYLAKLAIFVGFLVVPFAVWFLVPHYVLGTVAVGLALAATGLLIFRVASGAGLKDRVMSRARGMSTPVISPAFALAALAVTMWATSWFALMSPWS